MRVAASIAALAAIPAAFAQSAQVPNPASAPSDGVSAESAAIAQSLLLAGKPQRCRPSTRTDEIVVCGHGEDNARQRLPLRDDSDAARSIDDGVPRAPDVFGIHHGGVTAARGCFLPPCPPPLMPIIDLAAIPEAPPGSDADRIGRGEIRQ